MNSRQERLSWCLVRFHVLWLVGSAGKSPSLELDWDLYRGAFKCGYVGNWLISTPSLFLGS